MFEKAIAGVLTHALGAYVEDLNGEQLRFGLLSGHIQLRDLRLRASAFESLRLPVELVSGSIGELDVRVDVPWSALWSSWLNSDISVAVVVRNVRVELAARWDVSQVRARSRLCIVHHIVVHTQAQHCLYCIGHRSASTSGNNSASTRVCMHLKRSRDSCATLRRSPRAQTVNRATRHSRKISYMRF